jgi:hypothetical protein
MSSKSPKDDKLQKSKSIVGCPKKMICVETIGECSCLYAPPCCLLFVNGADDHATTCALSRRYCQVNETAVKTVYGGLSHLKNI